MSKVHPAGKASIVRLLGHFLSGRPVKAPCMGSSHEAGASALTLLGPDSFSALVSVALAELLLASRHCTIAQGLLQSCPDGPPVHCAGTMPPCGYATPVRVLVDSGFVATSTHNKSEESLQLGATSPDAPDGPSGLPATSLEPSGSTDEASADAVLFCGAGTPLLCWR